MPRVTLLVAGVGLLVAGAAAGRGTALDEVRAERFVLVDEQGNETAWLANVEGRPQLIIFDDGAPVLVVGLGPTEVGDRPMVMMGIHPDEAAQAAMDSLAEAMQRGRGVADEAVETAERTIGFRPPNEK